MFGNGGEGSAGDEIVVEVLLRGSSDRGIGVGTGRKRAVEKTLEGWVSVTGMPCELSELQSLKSLWSKKVVAEAVGRTIQPLACNITDIWVEGCTRPHPEHFFQPAAYG